MRPLFFSSLALTLILGACVMLKARLQGIRGLAIVSLFAPDRVPEVRGQGVLRKMDNDARLQVAEDALDAFQNAFAKLGWHIAPTEEILAARAYKAFSQLHPHLSLSQGQASYAFRRRFFSPSGMIALWLDAAPPEIKHTRQLTKKDDRQLIMDLLHSLGMDAAASIQLRYCFRASEQQRKQFAFVSATSAVQLIDRKGQILYQTNLADGCGEKARGESVRSVQFKGEDWIYDPYQRDTVRQLFREATTAEAQRLVESLPVTPLGH